MTTNIKLTGTELEMILGLIDDPIERGINGIELFQQDPDKAKKYGKEYLQAIMAGGEGAEKELRRLINRKFLCFKPPISDVDFLRSVGDDELVSEYLRGIVDIEMEFDVRDGSELTQEHYRNLAEVSKIEHILKFEDIAPKEVLQGVLSLGMKKELSKLKGRASYDYNSIQEVLGIADDHAIEITEEIKAYIDRRIDSATDLDFQETNFHQFRFDGLYELAERFEHRVEDVKDLYLASIVMFGQERIEHSDEVTLPTFDDLNLDRALEIAYEVFTKVVSEGKKGLHLYRLVGQPINNDDFQKRYAKDPKIQGIVRTKIQNTTRIDWAQKIAQAYSLDDLTDTDIVKIAVRNKLGSGKFHQALDLATKYGVTIDHDTIEAGRELIKADVKSHANTAVYQSIDSAKSNLLKLRALDYLQEHGGLEPIPQSNLTPDYDGGFLLLEFQGEHYIRSIPDRDTDINDELQSKGFDKFHSRGGARIRRKDGALQIYGKLTSVDECDKALAKELIQKQFPDEKVKYQKSRKRFG
jgi:hypothetical protein